MNPGSKVIIAPKLQGSLIKPLGGGIGSSIGTSSILNLPVLGADNVLQPTSRGLKGMDSNKQFFNNEDSHPYEVNKPNPTYF